jgi:hypothetical protein
MRPPRKDSRQASVKGNLLCEHFHLAGNNSPLPNPGGENGELPQQYYEDKGYQLPPEPHLGTYGTIRRTIGNHVREVAMTIVVFRTLSDSSLSGMLLTGSTTK